jgi:hypothetical protein
MAMKKRPQGKFVAGKVEAPRKITIRGETHYLVYVTPEEAKDLKKAGGSGEAGPKGIPAFRKGGGRSDRGRSSSKDKVDKATDKDKVDKATDAKSSDKSTGGSNKSGGPTGGRGSEKSTPAPRDRDDRQPTPAPKSTPKPAPGDRDDRQPAPAPKSTPKPAPGDRDDRQPTPTPTPKPATRGIVVPDSNKAKVNGNVLDPNIGTLDPSSFSTGATITGTSPTDTTDMTKYLLEAYNYPAVPFDRYGDTTDFNIGGPAQLTQEPAPFTPVVATNTVAPTVAPPPVDTTGGIAAVKTNVPFKGTMEDGVLLDRLGNPVVTNAKGYGYLDPLTGLAVTPWTDSINGGGPGYGGAALGSGGGAALDTNKDNYISEAEIAAGKAKGLELEQNAMVKIRYWVRRNPTRFGYRPDRSCWSC